MGFIPWVHGPVIIQRLLLSGICSQCRANEVILCFRFILKAQDYLIGPDEFSVLKNPPLVVPPDFHLRPPGDESETKGAFTPQEIARRALFGDPKNQFPLGDPKN